MRSKRFLLLAVFGLALLVAGCGDDESDVGSGTEESPRVVEVSALDPFAFEPTSIEVGEGEKVRFVVTNEGAIAHEFVVGDRETQEMAEEQAMQGEHGHMEAMASLSLDPGQTAETTVMFDEAGGLFYACHVEGHYEGGMVGTITVP